MSIADRAAAFLSNVAQSGANVLADVGDAAYKRGGFAEKVSPMFSRTSDVLHAGSNALTGLSQQGQPGGNLLGQIGMYAGTALAGKPSAKLSSYLVPNVYQNKAGDYIQYKGTKGGKPAAVAAPYTRIPQYSPTGGPVASGSINTLGGMLNKNFPQIAAPIQRMMATTAGSQMLGAGVVGAGVLGLGAIAGVAAMQHQRYQQRKAGQALGAQLGVMMPPQY